ncbi:hypothetical protein [Spirosoma validum]|uniref:Uncharacterized protein n=1 Tax=Spirosoma validum TaxID=2771355 RepID=A0A927B7J2_9BACT|nr:hypothetical protein [Spirosoma validum]MBD2756647.1 hypothetical protein [Spirosoma validum]
MKQVVKKPTLQDQQVADEPLLSSTEEVPEKESEKTARKDHLRFLVEQAQELNLGYE